MPEHGLQHADRRLRVLIAAYLGKPRETPLSEAEIEGLARKFFGFCNGELSIKTKFKMRDFKDFLSQNHTIYGPIRERFLQFFQKRWPFLDESVLHHEIDGFEANFYRKLAEHTKTLVIHLGAPLRVFSELDREFLVGVYELYRHSFANEGKINVDLMVIKPDPMNPAMLQMEVVVWAMRKDKKNERFEGLFCQYGHSLLGLPVFVDFVEDENKYARVRRYEFSDSSLQRIPANLVKIGIVSGNSIQLKFPVAAKCLISKLSNDPARVAAYSSIPRRYDSAKLYQPYVEAISNDIRKQDDNLLVAWSSKPPRARSRDTFPELPQEPHDPAETLWPNR